MGFSTVFREGPQVDALVEAALPLFEFFLRMAREEGTRRTTALMDSMGLGGGVSWGLGAGFPFRALSREAGDLWTDETEARFRALAEEGGWRGEIRQNALYGFIGDLYVFWLSRRLDTVPELALALPCPDPAAVMALEDYGALPSDPARIMNAPGLVKAMVEMAVRPDGAPAAEPAGLRDRCLEILLGPGVFLEPPCLRLELCGESELRWERKRGDCTYMLMADRGYDFGPPDTERGKLWFHGSGAGEAGMPAARAVLWGPRGRIPSWLLDDDRVLGLCGGEVARAAHERHGVPIERLRPWWDMKTWTGQTLLERAVLTGFIPRRTDWFRPGGYGAPVILHAIQGMEGFRPPATDLEALSKNRWQILVKILENRGAPEEKQRYLEGVLDALEKASPPRDFGASLEGLVAALFPVFQAFGIRETALRVLLVLGDRLNRLEEASPPGKRGVLQGLARIASRREGVQDREAWLGLWDRGKRLVLELVSSLGRSDVNRWVKAKSARNLLGLAMRLEEVPDEKECLALWENLRSGKSALRGMTPAEPGDRTPFL